MLAPWCSCQAACFSWLQCPLLADCCAIGLLLLWLLPARQFALRCTLLPLLCHLSRSWHLRGPPLLLRGRRPLYRKLLRLPLCRCRHRRQLCRAAAAALLFCASHQRRQLDDRPCMAAHIAGVDAGCIGQEASQLHQALPRLGQLAVQCAPHELEAGGHVVQGQGHLQSWESR